MGLTASSVSPHALEHNSHIASSPSNPLINNSKHTPSQSQVNTNMIRSSINNPTSSNNTSVFQLREAPVFYPTLAEWEDPMTYISTIQDQVEPFGMCRVVPPPEWDRNTFEQNVDPDQFVFSTKCQSIHLLQNRIGGKYESFMTNLQFFWTVIQKQPIKNLPLVDSRPIDLYQLYKIVENQGGYTNVAANKLWKNVLRKLKLDPELNQGSSILSKLYLSYLEPFIEWCDSENIIPDHNYRISTNDDSDLQENSKKRKREESDLETNQAQTDKDDSFLVRKSKRIKSSSFMELFTEKFGMTNHFFRKNNSTATHDQSTSVHSSITTSTEMDSSISTTEPEEIGSWRNIRHHSFRPTSKVALIRCYHCSKGDRAESLVVCDNLTCLYGAHLDCMNPPKKKPPRGEWFCPACNPSSEADSSLEVINLDSEEEEQSTDTQETLTLSTPNLESILWDVDFGYDEGQKYTLSDYKLMAARFSKFWTNSQEQNQQNDDDNDESIAKKTRFASRKSMIGDNASDINPLEAEKDYWDTVIKGDRMVQVHYGSDVDVNKVGSGFPLDKEGQTVGKDCPELPRWRSQKTRKQMSKRLERFLAKPSTKESPKESTKESTKESAKESNKFMELCGWNINSLPYVTLLKHLHESISGVTRPMMYVGMLFSTFCWHTEDNWLYSINYIHTGAPKRWYGVSGHDAPLFEQVMKNQLPHLFKKEPQLLYQLVTMLSPEILQAQGVPVCTTLHNAGEFVITFPRAYHAGFNLGFNVAESVNFAGWSWLEWGLKAVNEYRNRRSSVFPHEQILTQLAIHHQSEFHHKAHLQTVYDQLSACIDLYNKKLQELIKLEKGFQKREIKFGKTKIEAMDSGMIIESKIEDLASSPKRAYHKADADPSSLQEDGEPQCFVCGYDCYLHRVQCECKEPTIYLCLKHAERTVCPCPVDSKRIHSRYLIRELIDIRNALEVSLKKMEHSPQQKKSTKSKRIIAGSAETKKSQPTDTRNRSLLI